MFTFDFFVYFVYSVFEFRCILWTAFIVDAYSRPWPRTIRRVR